MGEPALYEEALPDDQQQRPCQKTDQHGRHGQQQQIEIPSVFQRLVFPEDLGPPERGERLLDLCRLHPVKVFGVLVVRGGKELGTDLLGELEIGQDWAYEPLGEEPLPLVREDSLDRKSVV